MGRGIIIDNLNTYDDWGLILTAIELNPPDVKTKYVELPIGNGSIDLTDALLGEASFEDRRGFFSFDVLVPVENRAGLISTMGSYIQGKKRKVILPDDLDHYYYGRLAITRFRTQGLIGKLEIEIVCDPYKYKLWPTVYSGTIGSGGSKNLVCANSRQRAIPQITVSNNVTITFKGNTYSVSAGTWMLTNIIFEEGQNHITLNGASATTYAIEYQEGAI